MKLTDLIAKESERTKQEIIPPKSQSPAPVKTFKKERPWLEEDRQIEPKVQKEPKVDLVPQDDFAPTRPADSNYTSSQPAGEASSQKIPKVQKAPKVSFDEPVRQHAARELLNKHSEKFDTGFTRVPNEILTRLVSGEFSKIEAQVLIAILRLTIGFNQKSAPISISVLSKLTNLPSSKISHALNRIEELALISRVSGGTNSPNKLTIQYSESAKIDFEGKADKEPKVQKVPEVQNGPKTLGTKSALDLRYEMDLHYIQETNKHSPTEKNQIQFEGYFSKLAPGKIKKERAALDQLEKKYDAAELSRAFEYIQKHGELLKGEQCHSPFSYLSQAMEEVLKKTRPRSISGKVDSAAGAHAAVEIDDLDREIDQEFRALPDFQTRVEKFSGDHEKAKAMWSIERFKNSQKI